ncbi:2OG-Fe(II) oxygenase family protein [Teredinibacter sp. KSP-S5-2]|uniref:2OG-Fe(II) oxygenase family protein n=1 Tax=Teredinibacter sp. KSP-S5-2 TaxID=3034506 RepID=UPI00293455E9|nr:2OG-Fe(II) oxygenase family protein [Teredinibacter sp. KSP-S5-2]WNO10788.1 2OG-Fe(II) oxygenase family protein [Teredinibacter sp. KSP-S5-2]
MNQDNKTHIDPLSAPEFSDLIFNELNWNSEEEIPEGVKIFDLEELEKGLRLDELKESLEKSYPFYIKNFGIHEDEVENIFNTTRRFFRKSEAEKRAMVHERLPIILRGYSAYGTGAYENSINNGKAINQYAKYAWGPSENVYPDDGFKNTFQDMIDKLIRVSDRTMDCIGKALDLKQHPEWDNLFDGEDTVLHCQCYYPEKPLGVDRMVTHADASSITLLTQLPARNGHVGLKAKMDDKYVPIPPVRGSIVVMTGETMNSLTNGRVQPVMHAVTGPATDIENSERSSMPFFANPKNTFKMQRPPVSTHHKFYNEDNSTTFGDYSNNIAVAYKQTEEVAEAV